MRIFGLLLCIIAGKRKMETVILFLSFKSFTICLFEYVNMHLHLDAHLVNKIFYVTSLHKF